MAPAHPPTHLFHHFTPHRHGRVQVNVLAYEYSGYGKSEGTVSEDNCYADIRAAYDYLTTQKKTPPKQIVL